MWTDSLTSGIIKVIKQHPDYNLYVEYLDCKEFGNSKFEIEKNHIEQKYAGVSFAGILVTDNDALDFAIQYEKELFSNRPVVFAGISNPEDYQLEGSSFYGYKEVVYSDSIVDFVKKILPEAKRLLVLTDLTTTGLIYRKDFAEKASIHTSFTVFSPDVIDLDSIYKMVGSEKDYDAIYFLGLNQDRNGQLIDVVPFVQKICQLSKVPVFTNNPVFIGKGVIGGIFQSGRIQGFDAANLLIQLINSDDRKSFQRINISDRKYFFDKTILDRFGVSEKEIPRGAFVANEEHFFNSSNFGIMLIVLALLGFVVVILSVVNRRRLTKQRRSDRQLRMIEMQKDELQETHEQLGKVISELENANERLKEANASLFSAKKKAEESDNLKSAFLANVSHELRTPLNSIVGFSSMLCEHTLDDVTRKMYADLVESNTESLLVLIDEIIDLSKIEAQQLTLNKQEFSVSSLMTELFQIFSHSHQNPAVDLIIKTPTDNSELFVHSDRVRVKQIFINLLSNAFKFTDSGSIEMGFFPSETGEIIFYVKDSGIGIKQENHQAIFQRFRKLNENSGRVYRGTGLGLAITQKLVELLGGKIWIESELGEGAVFYFTLHGCVLKTT